MANQIKAPINYPIIAGGKIVSGGSVLFGQPNVKPDEDNPSTLKAVYLDAALSQQAENPQGISSDGVFDQSDTGILYGPTDTVYSIVIRGANKKELSYIPEYDLSDSNAAATAQDAAAAAASSEANALSFKNLTEALYTDFTNRYFGAFSSDPSADDLGNPPNEGSIYFNTVSDVFFTWNGSAWINYFPSNPNGLMVTATGTTTPRSLSDRFGDVVNVRDFGIVGDGIADDTAAFQTALNSGKPLLLLDDIYITQVILPNGTYIVGNGSINQLTNPLTTMLTSTVNVNSFIAHTININERYAVSGKLDRGVSAKNEIYNSNFHTWARFDARGVETVQYLPPTFGDPATYDGTGGLRTYFADMWYAKQYGKFGEGTITRQLSTGDERAKGAGDYKVNYTAVSVIAPPNKFNIVVTAATSLNASTCTITVGSHSLEVGDYFWWDGNSYNGGNGSFESTFQVTSKTATTITFNTGADEDSGFTSWTNFGRVTDDPDNKGVEHIHDPSLGTFRKSWMRNGTSGYELGSRIPINTLSGRVTVRVKIRLNSGHTDWFVRIAQSHGQGGSSINATTMPGFSLVQGEIKEFTLQVDLPDLSSETLAKGSFIQPILTQSIFEPDFDVDIFEFSMCAGEANPSDIINFSGEVEEFKKFYNIGRVSLTHPVESGRYYGLPVSYSNAMYGTQEVTVIDNPVSSSVAFSSIAHKTLDGFYVNIQAQATVNVGQYLAFVESEYQIGTNGVGT